MLERSTKESLSKRDKERYLASQSLSWMHEAAVSVHRQFLVSLGVHECDAQRCLENSTFSRKRMYEFILQVMEEDTEFAENIRPCVQAVALLFEEES